MDLFKHRESACKWLDDPRAKHQEVVGEYRFLEYAVLNMLYHADAAQGFGISQTKLWEKLKLSEWIQLHNLAENFESHRYAESTSLLYVLANNNASNLIRIHPNPLSYFKVEHSRCQTPLFAALATKSNDAVHSFWELEIENHPEPAALRWLYDEYCRDGGHSFNRTSFERFRIDPAEVVYDPGYTKYRLLQQLNYHYH